MPTNSPRFLSLTGLQVKTRVDRGALERMISRGIITPDAWLSHGKIYVPMFLETRAPEIMIKRSEVVFRFHQLPNGNGKANWAKTADLNGALPPLPSATPKPEAAA